MTPDQRAILADLRAGLIDRSTAYQLLAYYGADPRAVLTPPPAPNAPQGWQAVYGRSA